MKKQIVLVAALMALSADAARADEWCGYATKDNAMIECGYTTAEECENAVGKGGMCFVDPDVALETRRARLFEHHPEIATQRQSNRDRPKAPVAFFEAPHSAARRA
jgi:hypothetical protein